MSGGTLTLQITLNLSGKMVAAASREDVQSYWEDRLS